MPAGTIPGLQDTDVGLVIDPRHAHGGLVGSPGRHRSTHFEAVITGGSDGMQKKYLLTHGLPKVKVEV